MGVARVLVRRPVEPALRVLLLPSIAPLLPRGDGEGAMSTPRSRPVVLMRAANGPVRCGTTVRDPIASVAVYALEATMSLLPATTSASSVRKRRLAPHRKALRRAGRRHGCLLIGALG